MTKLLVANRGEIALRVIRTARRMGIFCIAVYSDADANAPFVGAADEAVRIGPAPAAESYLNIEAIIEAAKTTGAELVHPGYGFLSENPDFVRACESAGLTFIGPDAKVMELMGDKAVAKRLAREAGAAILEGYDGEDQSDEAFGKAAAKIGYPVIAKAAAGGGGKGMIVIRASEDLVSALASTRRVAKAAFGDDRLVLERYVDGPRHVEVQFVSDGAGAVKLFVERDCSAQRRHQKVLEESPSPAVDDKIRKRLHESARAIVLASGYKNAGTLEFLLGADGALGFLECNARLQVEHPVTEMVSGVDLVELQIRTALGEPLVDGVAPFDGHSAEVRVYAEDPQADWLPQTGTVEFVKWPESARVDAGVALGSQITTHYDPMLAKVIVKAPTRADALHALANALDETIVLGLKTNVAFLADLARNPVVTSGQVTTTWLEGAYDNFVSAGRVSDALAAAAVAGLPSGGGSDPWSASGPWRMSGVSKVLATFTLEDNSEATVAVGGSGPWTVGDLTVQRDGEHFLVDGRRVVVVPTTDGWLAWSGDQFELFQGPAPRLIDAATGRHLSAPMPGQVVAVNVAEGDRVTRGQELIVVEAMKMEHAVHATSDGTVTSVMCSKGDQVQRGQVLVDVEADSEI